jgi:glutathione-regulated potassium-efflux system ancillary protein KefG
MRQGSETRQAAAVPEKRILVLFAHPAIEKSRVNRRLLATIEGVGGVTVHDLYEVYPDFFIDVAAEQARLESHDVVVFQHPFYWYSTPSILKEWQDLVLEHGWAYGTQGHALEGKWLLSAISAGGREASYATDGSNRFTMRQLLAPIEQMARLCGMTYLPPFVVHGTHRMSEEDILRHADDYRRVLEALRDGRLEAAAVGHLPRLNLDLDSLLRGAVS